MNKNEVSIYLKILSKIEIPTIFKGKDQEILNIILNTIKNNLVEKLSSTKNLEDDFEHIKKIIISMHSIISIYLKNFIYLDNDIYTENKINSNYKNYYVLKARTSDFNSVPIYTYISLNNNKNIINITTETLNNEIFTKIIIYENKNKIQLEIIVEETKDIDKLFGEELVLKSIKTKEFNNFINNNIKFLRKNKKPKESLNLEIE